MRVSDTTKVINRIFNYYDSLNVDFRAIAELGITNSNGSTKIDFLVLLKGQLNEYFAFELKYNQKNLQSLSQFSKKELNHIHKMIKRVQDQYQTINSLATTDWDPLQFPHPVGNVNKIYVFINSVFINEFLTLINFDATQNSYFSLNRQDKGYLRGPFESVLFLNAEELIAFITTREELLVIPFTLADLDFKKTDYIPFSEVSRKQGRLLLTLTISFLREKISTTEKTFRIENLYNSIFGEIEDRFSFGRADKKNLIRILNKYCTLLSEIIYYKDRRVLSRDGDTFRINIRNSNSRDKVLAKVEKILREQISIKILDEFM